MRAEQHIGDMRQKELALRISTLEACDPDKLFCDEIQTLVQEAISELPPTSREVFILSRMKNLPNKEIALRLDISVKTVEFHITRSLKQLRVQLKDYQFLWSFYKTRPCLSYLDMVLFLFHIQESETIICT